MLKELKIKNFVLVKDLNLSFKDKLTVLTGETGAGKSVIAGALHLVLGEQLKSDVYYNNLSSVELEAIFDISNLMDNKSFMELCEKYEIDITEKEIFFFREIKPDGRSSIFINGRKSTNAIVKEFRSILLDFHSQRDQQTLFDEDTQLNFLDNYANLLENRETYYSLYQKWADSIKKLKRHKEDNQKNQDKIMLYQYQIEEIESADLKEGEEQELDKEYNILSNAKEIKQLFSEMNAELFESDRTVFDILRYYENRLQNYSEDSKFIKNTVECLGSSIAALDDIGMCMRYVDDEILSDEERLAFLEMRIKTLFDLKTKYRKNINELNDYLIEMKDFISNYENNIETEELLIKEIEVLQEKTYNLALEIEKERLSSAKVFEEKIKEFLRELAINDADFKIVIDRINEFESMPSIENFNFTGINKVKYMFSANKGMPLQELKATISGGELSRLLLVIKSILAQSLTERTIIFDEIDSGIGGKTANKLGFFIKNISKSHQILCISHLAQIAALADQHLIIEKISMVDKSAINVKDIMNYEDKKNEIARMLSGNITETALEHAEELLKNVNK